MPAWSYEYHVLKSIVFGDENKADSLEMKLALSYLMWVLRTKPQSTESTASAFHGRAISPVQMSWFSEATDIGFGFLFSFNVFVDSSIFSNVFV